MLWLIDTCQIKLSSDQYHMTISRAQVYKADVSSVSPSSERIEELWVVCGLYTEGGATLLAGAW